MSRHPPVKWAQRSDEVYITVELPDAQDVKLKLEPEGKFYFSATTDAEKIPYEIDIDLFDKVDVNNSKVCVGSRSIFYLVAKAEDKWWDRLLKQRGKPPAFLKVDWDKWVDEHDEVDVDGKIGADMDFGNFDFSKLSLGGGEELDTEATNNADDDESDSEDEVTGQTSIDNEADTKEKVDVANEADTKEKEADTKEKVDVARTDPIKKSVRVKKAPVWAKDYYMG
ncbi:co-chaperone protein p23-1-like [Arachis stenosperma]|uniref:co-chaperone protein p23-1-like n=1 Tax=Arachis stenosperma TaxID=217475 RepID=UPI0025ABF674|nr:co-chaperone protein p23-1-like [Arachis stenosperma]